MKNKEEKLSDEEIKKILDELRKKYEGVDVAETGTQKLMKCIFGKRRAVKNKSKDKNESPR